MAKLTRSCNRHALLLSLAVSLFVSLSRCSLQRGWQIRRKFAQIGAAFDFLANWGNFQATKEREREREKEGEHEKKAMQDACVDAAPLASYLSLSLSVSGVCFAHCTCDFSHVFYLLFAILLSFAGCCSVHTQTYVYPRKFVCMCVSLSTVIGQHWQANVKVTRREAPHPTLHCSSYLSPSSKVAGSCAIIYAIIS